MEDAARQLELFAQFGRVCEVPVVGNGHGPLYMANDKRLRIGAQARARGGIAAVADAHLPAGHGVQHVLCEHFVHKAQLAALIDDAAVVYGNAAALLPAVLQGIQRIIRRGHHVVAVPVIHAEHAAFLMQLFVQIFLHISSLSVF